MDTLPKVCFAVAEVATSAVLGASVLSPIPPLALLMLPICALSSVVSIATNEIFTRALNVEDEATALRFTTKSISLLIGATVGLVATAAILFPISLEAALVIGTVIALATIIAAVVTAIIQEGPEIYSNGFNSYSFNIGFSPTYSSSSYYPRRSTFLPRGLGLPARSSGRARF